MPKDPFDFSNLEKFESHVIEMFRGGPDSKKGVRFLDFKKQVDSQTPVDKNIAFTAMIRKEMVLNPDPELSGAFKQLSGEAIGDLLPIEMTLAQAYNYSSLEGKKAAFMTKVIEGIQFDALQALRQSGILDYIYNTPNKFERTHMKINDSILFVEKLRELQQVQYSDPANIDAKAIELFKDFLKTRVILLEALEVNLAPQVKPDVVASPAAPTGASRVKSMGGLLKTFSLTKMKDKDTLAAVVSSQGKKEAAPVAKETKLLMQDPKIKDTADQFIVSIVALIAKDPEYVLGLMPERYKQFSDFLTSKFLSEEISAFEDELKAQGFESSKSEKLGDIIDSLKVVQQASEKLEDIVKESLNAWLSAGMEGRPKLVAETIVKGINQNRVASSASTPTASQETKDSHYDEEALNRSLNRRRSIILALEPRDTPKPKPR